MHATYIASRCLNNWTVLRVAEPFRALLGYFHCSVYLYNISIICFLVIELNTIKDISTVRSTKRTFVVAKKGMHHW